MYHEHPCLVTYRTEDVRIILRQDSGEFFPLHHGNVSLQRALGRSYTIPTLTDNQIKGSTSRRQLWSNDCSLYAHINVRFDASGATRLMPP